VFEDAEDLQSRINDPALEVTPDSVLVLKNAGPVGAPGMPEWGMLPIPQRLLQAGVRDIVRISDARMSGTSYGTCVLHVAPESAVGGPLGLVRDGDVIDLDVPKRRLDLLLGHDELERRRAELASRPTASLSGYGELFVRHVTQANLGCDFDFLTSRPAAAEPLIY
jgi:dihydroxy-acid dehydratase